MGAIEMGLRGDLDVLDGMVIPYVCDTTRNLFHIWGRCFPQMFNEFLRLPKRLGLDGAREYLVEEFARLLKRITRLTGLEVSHDGLMSSINLYDRSRHRLRDAYQKQLEQPERWTQEKVQILFRSALTVPRETHLAWMDSLPWEEQEKVQNRRVQVYVRGKVWDPPGILGLFDEFGLLVVRDEIVTGWRYVSEDAGASDDPLAALVNRHMSLVPYPGYHLEPAKAVQSFLDRVNSSGARGVIFMNPKFCDAAGFDMPDFQKALEQARIPSLILETSSRGVSLEQIRLRLEAFQELLSGDLP
jgi:benzoyl-CoA reductase/2-hydroxyglutaryl-CoA dehydratase subunit BcrC/BadD/HgdB